MDQMNTQMNEVKIEIEPSELDLPPIKKLKANQPNTEVPEEIVTRQDIEEDFIPFNAPKEAPSKPQHTHYRRTAPIEKPKNLPVNNHITQLITSIENNQVVIITGGTGCGKSTQVPQIILKHFSSVENDDIKMQKQIKIICTQPRRIAAKSLATRVAAELDINLGNTVGYQVGMDALVSHKNTQILFVTTGIFLQKLVHDRERLFQEFTHIIMDEVHERDIDIDFCLIMMKNFLKHYPSIKLILMSATICSSKFANYFSKQSIQLVDNPEYIQMIQSKYRNNFLIQKAEETWNSITKEEDDELLTEEWGNAWRQMEQNLKRSEEQKVIEAQNERMREEGLQFLTEEDEPAIIVSIKQSQQFLIETYYLETIHTFFQEMDIFNKYEVLKYQESIFFQDAPRIQKEQLIGMLEILKFIDATSVKQNFKTKVAQQNGSVLIFLPGYQEIMDIREEIFQKFGEDRFDIMVLHSTIAVTKDFNELSKTKRRIILSTNIAESSITVPDCLFVIDFCMTKELIYNPKNLTEKLALQYCSKASCDQRKGRTGRLFPGYCFRLIPQILFNQRLSNYAQCEMLRCPLEKIILKLKKLHQMEVEYFDKELEMKTKNESKVKLEQQDIVITEHKVRNIFDDVEKTLSTAIEPPSLAQIGHAIKNLQRLGALTMNSALQYVSITQLGLFMCDMPIDIFLTRLIMISCILGCGMNGVTVAAILSQKKNFFTHQFVRDQQYFINTLYLYDNGDEDDILIQLRIFNEWEQTFFGPFRITKERNNMKNTLKQFTNRSITLKERLYVKIRSIDPLNLREILRIKYELLMRLENDVLSSITEVQDLYNPDVIIRLKSAMAATFANKALQVKKDNQISVEKKLKFIHDYGADYKRTILIEGETLRFDGISSENRERIKEKISMLMEQYCEFNGLNRCKQRIQDQHNDIDSFINHKQYDVRKFYCRTEFSMLNDIKAKSKSQKLWIKNIQIQNSMVIIQFQDQIPLNQLMVVLKKFMHECEFNHRQAQRKWEQNQDIFNTQVFDWQQFVLSDQMDMVRLVAELHSIVFHGAQARIAHQYSQKEIACDIDSINFIQIQYGKHKDTDKYLVAYEIQEKERSKRNMARSTVCVMNHMNSQYQMWMQLIAMIFGVQVKLFHDTVKSHFIKARADDKDFSFDHFITEDDLTQINDIRSQVKNKIENTSKIDLRTDIWHVILELNKQRSKILFTNEELWRSLFDFELKEQIQSICVESEENKQKRRKVRRIAVFNTTEEDQDELKVECAGFMDPIQIVRTDYDTDFPKQFDNEGIRIYSQINQLYFSWKTQVLQQIKKQNFFLRMGNIANLCCAQCQDYITFGRSAGLIPIDRDVDFKGAFSQNPTDRDWMKRVLMVLEVSNFGDYFNICSSHPAIIEFMSDQLVQSILTKLEYQQDPNKFIFMTCVSSKHIIGFYPKSKLRNEISQTSDVSRIYIMDSKLRLVFSSMREELFVFRKYPLALIQQLEKEELQKRKISNPDFACKACYNEDNVEGRKYFYGHEAEYTQHVKMEYHKKHLEQLQYSICDA